MLRMCRNMISRSVAVLAVLSAAVAWLFLRPGPNETRIETPTETAHRVCDDCGLGAGEIDRLIDELPG